jgi:hypothetical protein
MPKVSIKTLDEAAPVEAPGGAIDTRAYFQGEGDPIHLRLHRIAPGASLRLAADGADLSVYVWQGSVEAGGVTLEPRSSAVVEAGGALALTGGREGAAVLVFNARDQGQRPPSSGKVHLLPYERVPRTDAMGGTPGVGGALHADAHRPTSRVWLHENDYAMADKETVPHSHSEDEVIFVRAGTIRLGARSFGPGTAIFVAANTRYGFFSGEGGLSFVNFRYSSPTYTTADGKLVLDEAELWRKAVGAPEYLTA